MYARGISQGHLMSQSKMLKRWTPRYFVLDNGYLSHYEKKSLKDTKKVKVSERRSRVCILSCSKRKVEFIQVEERTSLRCMMPCHPVAGLN